MNSLHLLLPDDAAALSRVRLLAMDVDGVLTDGGLYYGPDGAKLKRFCVADGLGIVLLGFIGVTVAWITGRADASVKTRADELKVKHLVTGVHDKGAALKRLIAELGFTPDQTAYMGDDWNDIPALREAGVAIAVHNAHPALDDYAHLRTILPGGAGAVREVCDALIESRSATRELVEAYIASLQEASGEEPISQ